LVRQGASVLVLDNFSHGKRENLSQVIDRIGVMEGDIRDPEDCALAMRDRALVFHLAALGSVPASVENPRLYHEVNITGTFNVLQAAAIAGVKRVVYSASSSAYGDTPVLPKVETMPPAPLSPYALTKLVGEYYCQVFSELYGLSTACLRYFNVYGPRQNPKSLYAAVIPAFIDALRKGEPPRIYGDGEQTRDFCYVENVVRANLLAATCDKPLAGEVMNIACAQRTSLNALLKTLQVLLGTTVTPQYLPPRAGDVRDSLADIRSARMLIGYEPQVLMDAGLALTVKAYASG
jgi:nucleoside-diphosphate-sugar epimerase